MWNCVGCSWRLLSGPGGSWGGTGGRLAAGLPVFKLSLQASRVVAGLLCRDLNGQTWGVGVLGALLGGIEWSGWSLGWACGDSVGIYGVSGLVPSGRGHSEEPEIARNRLGNCLGRSWRLFSGPGGSWGGSWAALRRVYQYLWCLWARPKCPGVTLRSPKSPEIGCGTAWGAPGGS